MRKDKAEKKLKTCGCINVRENRVSMQGCVKVSNIYNRKRQKLERNYTSTEKSIIQSDQKE